MRMGQHQHPKNKGLHMGWVYEAWKYEYGCWLERDDIPSNDDTPDPDDDERSRILIRSIPELRKVSDGLQKFPHQIQARIGGHILI
jgi:hypothetical protein